MPKVDFQFCHPLLAEIAESRWIESVAVFRLSSNTAAISFKEISGVSREILGNCPVIFGMADMARY